MRPQRQVGVLGAAALTLALSQACASRGLTETPRLAPNPGDAYAGFAALDEPRAEIPVGALWVQGYGSHGAGAAPDNLETVRGVSALAIGRSMQLSLTLGLLRFLGVDPLLRDQMSVRFTDVSIVRVKDLSKLEGPTGEPRIVEALRAGSITVSTDSSFSLNADGGGILDEIGTVGRANGGRTRTFALEARDMFVAMRVVTPRVARSGEKEVKLGRDSAAEADVEGYRIAVDASEVDQCVAAAADATALETCSRGTPLIISIARARAGDASDLPTQNVTHRLADAVGSLRVPLPVPVADGRGGLLTHASIQARLNIEQRASATSHRRFSVGPASTIVVALEGWRFEPLDDPRGSSSR